MPPNARDFGIRQTTLTELSSTPMSFLLKAIGEIFVG